MNISIKEKILQVTGASDLFEKEKIQDLWSGYGVIMRYALVGAAVPTVVVKHVRLPEGTSHLRGSNTALSHRRKLKSYAVEMAWYQKYSELCSERCAVPRYLASEAKEDEFILILEDLNNLGYELRRRSVSPTEMRVCLKWLAHFHTTFMGQVPEDLWAIGTYWHLETRPDELNALKDKALKNAALRIDQKLKQSPFQTFVHGDAKLENFCFSSDVKKVAAVDFQYVGGGCGMKDVAYFIGSCLSEDDCEKYEKELLDYYFSVLGNVLKSRQKEVDVKALEENWRSLYPVAWTDFHRFIKGWSPGHWKTNGYSERLAREVIEAL